MLLLRFEDGSREAFHSHAFNALSWVLRGMLSERFIDGRLLVHNAALKLRAIVTRRDDFHKVTSYGRTWVLSFRTPWADQWMEYIPGRGEITLTPGREVVA